MTDKTSESPLEWNDSESPIPTFDPGLPTTSASNERELQLLCLGLVSGRGLNSEDAARLSGELPVAELKLRAKQYLEDCELNNKPDTLAAKRDVLAKFFSHQEAHGHEKCGERDSRPCFLH